MPGATPLKGLHCPVCRGVRLAVSHTRNPAPGVRVRYQQCTACSTRVKTREVVVAVTSARIVKPHS
jgi:transcriptional regulator NrdR family protein